MGVQANETVENGPMLGSEVPAVSQPPPDLTNDCSEVEGSKTSEVAILPVESPQVKRATDKIVTNAVTIDVITPVRDSENSEGEKVKVKPRKVLFKGVTKMNGKDKRESIFERGVGAVQTFCRRRTAGLSRTQVAILCIFPFVEFFAATVISIQGPFYPAVARAKGATPIEYGVVFASFELTVFIMAPIYGAHMGKFNPHRLFNYGIFTTSLCCILFGFVHHLENRASFILVSLIIRIIEAVGDAAFVTASFSIIAAEFPDSVAKTFAMMETFYGLGMIAGPTVGGELFVAGGFTLPFVMMGIFLFICAIATFIYITRASTDTIDSVVASSSFEMFKMLKIPAIALTAYGAFAAATGIGYLTNNLEHHLEQFQLDASQVGRIFMLNGGVYALSAPFWGMLCDKTSQLKVYSVIGAILTILGFILIGPLPFISSWNPTIIVICIGLVIFGLGLGSTLVSAFIQFLQDALANGHPDDVRTYGLVSGLWTSMVALGFFVGPTCGGILDHFVEFRWGTLFIIVQQIILVGLLGLFFFKLRKSPEEPVKELEEEEEKDNLEDVVITYAVKMNTPKPMSRRKKNKVCPQDADKDTAAIIPAPVADDINTDMVTANAEIPENSESTTLTDDDTLTAPVENPPVQNSESDPALTDEDSSKAKSGVENPNFVADHS